MSKRKVGQLLQRSVVDANMDDEDHLPISLSNRRSVLQGIKDGLVEFRNLPEKFRDDAEIALAALTRWNSEFVSTRLKSDREFVLAAVKKCGLFLRFASEELRADPQVALAAIQQNEVAFQYASEALRSNREFVLEAVGRNGWALRHVSEELRGDREVVMVAVRQNGGALRYASAEPRADQEIVMMAIQQDASVFRYASEELRGNREIVLLALENTLLGDYVDWGVVNFIPNDNLQNDPMIAAAIIRNFGRLRHGSEIMTRLENVLLAVQTLLPDDFLTGVVDEASVLELCRRWEHLVWHKIWLTLLLEPPGMQGTGRLFVELSGLPLELRQVNELLHCAPVIGAVLSLSRDWRDLGSYPVRFASVRIR